VWQPERGASRVAGVLAARVANCRGSVELEGAFLVIFSHETLLRLMAAVNSELGGAFSPLLRDVARRQPVGVDGFTVHGVLLRLMVAVSSELGGAFSPLLRDAARVNPLGLTAPRSIYG
jgi:hypothetical protein